MHDNIHVNLQSIEPSKYRPNIILDYISMVSLFNSVLYYAEENIVLVIQCFTDIIMVLIVPHTVGGLCYVYTGATHNRFEHAIGSVSMTSTVIIVCASSMHNNEYHSFKRFWHTTNFVLFQDWIPCWTVGRSTQKKGH